MKGRGRWHRPRIIWFFGRRPPRRPRRHIPLAGAPRRPPKRWPRPHRIPWSSVTLYGTTLVLAGLVLWRVPPRSPGPAIPAMGHISGRGPHSWLERGLSGLNLSTQSLQDWMDQGIPLLGLVTQKRTFAWNWQSLMMTGLTDVSGIRLTSLNGLLTMEIPTLQAVAPGKVVSAPPKPLPNRPGQDAVMDGLPGDGSRIWAELGHTPQVGIYQTHSHESFWSELKPGSPTANSTTWSKTIVQVGWWLSQDLNRLGLGVIQSRVDNMKEGLLASYNTSYYTARQLLRWYPSVKVLIDLHRGQAARSETTTVVKGVTMSRILIIVGTNKLLPDPYWHQNLEFAMRLAKALGKVAPGILRGNGIEMVPYRYNQQLMPMDVLVEIGGPDNTLAEERYAAYELAQALADVMAQSSHHP